MKKSYYLLIFMILGFFLGAENAVHSDTMFNDEADPIDATRITFLPTALSSKVRVSSKSFYDNNVVISQKAMTSSKIGDYRNAVQAQNPMTMYKGFQKLASGVGLIYEQPELRTNEPRYLSFNGQRETIQLTYNNIGTYELLKSDGTTSKKRAGVRVTLSNIIVGAGPKWTNDKTKRPWIECSNYFSDGILYGNIKKMDADFVFYDSVSGKKLNFIPSSHAFLPFSSLNAYPNASVVEDTEKKGRHEFAGPDNLTLVRHIKVSQNSLISYHSKASSPEEAYDQYTFYAEKAIEGIDFTDYIAGKTFNRSSVQFPLYGIKNSFKFGSTYGRGWTSFSN